MAQPRFGWVIEPTKQCPDSVIVFLFAGKEIISSRILSIATRSDHSRMDILSDEERRNYA
jgi:hypothetical protein